MADTPNLDTSSADSSELLADCAEGRLPEGHPPAQTPTVHLLQSQLMGAYSHAAAQAQAGEDVTATPLQECTRCTIAHPEVESLRVASAESTLQVPGVRTFRNAPDCDDAQLNHPGELHIGKVVPALQRTEEAGPSCSGLPGVPESAGVQKVSHGQALPAWQQQWPRAELLKYDPVLQLSVECYRFDGITRADVANNYMEKLRYASWTYTARHLLGTCVHFTCDLSCLVVLDMVTLVDRSKSAAASIRGGLRSGAAVAASAASSLWALGSGFHALLIWVCASRDFRLRWKTGFRASSRRPKSMMADWWPRSLEAGRLKPDSDLGVQRVMSALLQRDWWRPRAWMRWLRLSAVRVPPATAYQPKDSAGSAAQRDLATRPVVACRITSVAPRVLLLDTAGYSTLGCAAAPVAQQRGTFGKQEAGAQCPGGGLPQTGLQITAAVCCCGGPSTESLASEGRASAAGCIRRQGYGTAGSIEMKTCTRTADVVDALPVELFLRQGQNFTLAIPLLGASTVDAPLLAPTKACRRSYCSHHVTLRQDVALGDHDVIGQSLGHTWKSPFTCGGLCPGLLLLEPQRDADDRQASLQRPVPVVMLDDGLVVAELQAALQAEKQVGANWAANNVDNLLIDLGTFVQYAAELRRVAAPVMTQAASGLLRHGRVPPCFCKGSSGGDGGADKSWACCSSSGGSGRQCIIPAAGCDPSSLSPAARAVMSVCDVAEDIPAASGAALPPPTSLCCVACALLLLRGFLDQYLSIETAEHLGEGLLRYASMAGWTRTASYILSCLIELRRIDVLAGALLGTYWDGEIGGYVYGQHPRFQLATSASTASASFIVPPRLFLTNKQLVKTTSSWLLMGAVPSCRALQVVGGPAALACLRMALMAIQRRMQGVLTLPLRVTVVIFIMMLVVYWCAHQLLVGALHRFTAQRGGTSHEGLVGLSALALSTCVAMVAGEALVAWCLPIVSGPVCHGGASHGKARVWGPGSRRHGHGRLVTYMWPDWALGTGRGFW